jgi:hypothetical protein
MLFPAPSAEGSFDGGGVVLTVGSGPGGADFQGKLGVVRIYDRQLNLVDIKRLLNMNSFDVSGTELSSPPSLLCNINKAAITATTQQPGLVAAPVCVSPFDDKMSGAGDLSFSRRPLGTAPRSLYVRLNENQTNLQSLQVEYDEPGLWTWDLLPLDSWNGIWLKATLDKQTYSGGLSLSDFAIARSSPRVPVVLPALEPDSAADAYNRALLSRSFFEVQGTWANFLKKGETVRSRATTASLAPLADLLIQAKQSQQLDVGTVLDYLLGIEKSLAGRHVWICTGPAAIYKSISLYGVKNPDEAPKYAESIVIDSRVLAAKQTDDRSAPYAFTQSRRPGSSDGSFQTGKETS